MPGLQQQYFPTAQQRGRKLFFFLYFIVQALGLDFAGLMLPWGAVTALLIKWALSGSQQFLTVRSVEWN